MQTRQKIAWSGVIGDLVCIWVKGSNPLWQRSYFDQLLPGRKGCRNHMFFKLLRERWGEALNNVLDYFKELIIDEEPCGFC
uniref:Transposase n=1 Tax=Meloidogyne floridensis TaxID=298350 RepID=A0A915NFK0_9BILA